MNVLGVDTNEGQYFDRHSCNLIKQPLENTISEALIPNYFEDTIGSI